MGSRGFIQLHRKIQDEWFWNNSQLAHLMISLILRANHELKEVSFKGEKRTIKRGEHITTLRDLGEALGFGRSTVGRYLKKLEKGNEIQLLPTKATHVRVLRYEYFLRDDFDSKVGKRWDKDGTKEGLNNNYNNDKNYENDDNIQTTEGKKSYDEVRKTIKENKGLLTRMREEFEFSEKEIFESIDHMVYHYQEHNRYPENWEGALKKWLLKGKKFKDGDYETMMAASMLDDDGY